MNFRTSYLAGILAAFMAVTAVPLSSEVRAAEPLKITGPDGQSREANQRQYGPTTPQDTFWSIAQKVRPDSSISIYQVMAAIYDANPHAFSGANYNTLEKGMILLIPSKEVMLAIPKNLAQQRAESQDKAWRTGKVEPKPVAKAETAKPEPKPEPVKTETVKQEPAPVAVPQVDPQLVEENQALSAEISRLTEALSVRKNDVEALTSQVNQLTEELEALKESAAQLEEQSAQLKAENKELKQSLALAEVEANQPDDMWRNLMDNPMLLVLGAVIPALFVLLLVWMFLRRRNKGEAAAMTEAPVATAAAGAAVATAAATAAVMADKDTDELAVHLDSGDDEDSLDSLLDMENVDLQPESVADEDLVVEQGDSDDFADEGQSLDDLWAEAMGEQAEMEDVMSADPADLMAELEMPSDDAEQAEDLDALMGELDTEVTDADQDLDALMAGLESGSEPVAAQEDDLDALMAGFDVGTEDTADSVKEDAAEEVEEVIGTDSEADIIAAELEAELTSAGTDAEDDLDALLAGFDAPGDTADEPEVEDTVAAELDEELGVSAGAEDDLDSLLAAFESPAEPEASVSADDSETAAIAAELDEELGVNEDVAEEDLDSLLAAFESPAEPEASVTADDSETAAIAAELDEELGVNEDVAEEDLDSLLAAFDAPTDTTPADDTLEMVTEASEDNLSDAIAAELDEDLGGAEESSEEDLDSLLAAFEAPVEPVGIEQDQAEEAVANIAADLDLSEDAADDLSDAIAAELDEDLVSVDESSEEDLDSLLASFDAPSELDANIDTLDIAAGLGDELPLSEADDDLDALLAGFGKDDEDNSIDFNDAALAGAAVAGAGAAAWASKDKEEAAEDSSKAAPKDPVAVSAKDSGFFDDLKSNKGSASVIEWDPSPSTADPHDSPDISDEDLLSAFAAQNGDGDDDFMLDVDESHSMTVDEALAALDASEKSKRQAKATMDNDLTSFQKENGFIDIDKLLNDADDAEPEPYRELEMEIGEVDNLIGDTPMVDVDDEENSVNAKLDLARAYIEIDDKDSARALLKEVEVDGNDRQKAEAGELLGEIG